MNQLIELSVALSDARRGELALMCLHENAALTPHAVRKSDAVSVIIPRPASDSRAAANVKALKAVTGRSYRSYRRANVKYRAIFLECAIDRLGNDLAMMSDKTRHPRNVRMLVSLYDGARDDDECSAA